VAAAITSVSPSIRAVKGFSILKGNDDTVLFGTWIKPHLFNFALNSVPGKAGFYGAGNVERDMNNK